MEAAVSGFLVRVFPRLEEESFIYAMFSLFNRPVSD